MLQQFFHVNVCVSDMDRSVAFYQDLGFKTVNDFTIEDDTVGDALGVKASKLRGVFMQLGDDPGAVILDLVQFIDPPTQGKPYPSLNNIGICRIAFSVEDIDKAYEDLKAKQVEFVAPLFKREGPDGNEIAFVCFKDPDGTILELISGF